MSQGGWEGETVQGEVRVGWAQEALQGLRPSPCPCWGLRPPQSPRWPQGMH